MNNDINVPRNGHARAMWHYTNQEGAPINLTGCTVQVVARSIAGAPTVLANAVASISSAPQGLIACVWNGADFDGYGNVMGECIASYDIKITHPDGFIDVPVHAHLYILPECTV
jgi:hypothetical protein